MSLELWEQKPNLKLESELSSRFERTDTTPKPIAFLRGSVKKYQIGIATEYTISETCYLIPRYVMIVFKGGDHGGLADQNLNRARQDNSC